MSEVVDLWSPLIQGGFAIFALALLGIVVWLIKQLLRVLADNNAIIAGNTKALDSVAGISGDTRDLMQQVRDELLKRPCLFKDGQK